MKAVLGILMLFLVSSFVSLESAKLNINFYNGSYDNLLRKAKKEKRPVFLEFTAEWCSGCKKMEKETYTSPNLIEYLNSNYLIYKVDVDTFDGMDIAEKFEIKSYPTSVILDYRGREKGMIKGFYPANYFIAEINKVASGNYRNEYVSSK